MILDGKNKEWTHKENGDRNGNYTVSRDHIKLIEEENYDLRTILTDSKKREIAQQDFSKVIPCNKQLKSDSRKSKWYAVDYKNISKSKFLKTQEERESKLAKLSNNELKKRALNAPKIPEKKLFTSFQSVRDPHVAAYFVKKEAKGICQLCKNPAPFRKKDGSHFLEVHHIKWLAKGGKDEIGNTVALCPNCHRKMHSLNRKKDVKKLKVATKKYAA